MFALHRVRRRLAGVAALALVTALPMASAVAVAQPAEAPIRVGIGPVDAATPMIYAAKAGLYKKYGLNVEVVKVPSGNALAAGVAGGSLDLAMASSMSAILAFARGLPFTVVGGLATYDAAKPDTALLVPTNSTIRSGKDLEGQTLAAVSLSDLNSVATFGWLEQQGVDRSTLKYVEIPASASLAAMDQNRIVASTIYEPFYTAMLSTGKVRVLGYPYDAVAKHFSEAVMFGTATWVGAHRDAVERYLRAVQEASSYIAAHENESAGVIGEFTGIDPASIANIHHATRGIAINTSDLQPVIDIALKYKVIPKGFAAQEMICTCALKR